MFPGWYSITDFGAVAGGKASTNRDAIEKAFKAIPTNGGILWIPPDDRALPPKDLGFATNGPVPWRTGVHILGAGQEISKIRQVDPDVDGVDGTDITGTSIKGVTISGPEKGGAGRGVYVRYQLQVATVRLQEVTVRGFGEDGIRLDRAIQTVFDQVKSQGHRGAGFNVLDGTSIDFRTTYALRCRVGYNLESIHYSGFTRASSDKCNEGYRIKNCRGVGMESCGSEEIYGVALTIDGSEVTALNFRNLDNRGGFIWVTGGSDGVVLITPHDQGPTAKDAFSLKVDDGCTVELRSPKLLAPQVLRGKVR